MGDSALNSLYTVLIFVESIRNRYAILKAMLVLIPVTSL
jgi:hypothetical protein